MKVSAVQYLVNYLEENFHLTDESFEIIEQAKKMEKDQIAEAYRTGVEEDVYNNPLRTGMDYYNEKFNK
jgi:hypothetical protein